MLVHLCQCIISSDRSILPHAAAFSQDPAGFLYPENLVPGLETKSQAGPEMEIVLLRDVKVG